MKKQLTKMIDLGVERISKGCGRIDGGFLSVFEGSMFRVEGGALCIDHFQKGFRHKRDNEANGKD